MRHVGERVHALFVALRHVRVVGGDGTLVGIDGVAVAAHSNVDVRRHMDEVPGARDQGVEAVGGGFAVAWAHGFNGVDVEMIRAGVAGVERQQAPRITLAGGSSRRAGIRPQPPGVFRLGAQLRAAGKRNSAEDYS